MSRRVMRLGSIRYINSLPVDLGLATGKIPFSAEIIRDVPAVLNQSILDEKIDISPVSTFWYAKNQASFLLLPNISISSESGVQSVLLFSRGPISQLQGKKIAVTSEGRTTPILLEVICRKFYGFAPHLTILPSPFHQLPIGHDAVLLIGDEALVHRASMEAQGFFVTDLSEEWQKKTGLAFVFALWVVRRKFFAEEPTLTQAAHKAILASKKWGLSHLEEVISEAIKQTNLPAGILRSYFSCLSYDLGESLLRGMNLYLRYAAECGLVPAIKPLEFFDRKMDS